MLIDAHHHYALHPLCPYADKYAEALEETAEKYGVDYFCVMGLGPMFKSFAGNEDVLKLSRKCDKVLPVAYIDVDKDTPDIVRRYHQEGYFGFKIIRSLHPYNNPSYMILYEAMAETGKFIYFHTGFLGAGPPLRDCSFYRPAFIDGIAGRFPETPIICAHLGFPWHDEAFALSSFNPNVYLDFTGETLGKLKPEWYRDNQLYDIHWDRIVFGTDSMAKDFAYSYNNYRNILNTLNIEERLQGAVFGETMFKLLKFRR